MTLRHFRTYVMSRLFRGLHRRWHRLPSPIRSELRSNENSGSTRLLSTEQVPQLRQSPLLMTELFNFSRRRRHFDAHCTFFWMSFLVLFSFKLSESWLNLQIESSVCVGNKSLTNIALADGLYYILMDFTIILMQLVFSFVSFFVDVWLDWFVLI